MLWVAGYPIRKPKIKCKACNKHYIPSKQIIIMCGYFRTDNPFCKWCQKLPAEKLNEMLEKHLKGEKEPTKPKKTTKK